MASKRGVKLSVTEDRTPRCIAVYLTASDGKQRFRMHCSPLFDYYYTKIYDHYLKPGHVASISITCCELNFCTTKVSLPISPKVYPVALNIAMNKINTAIYSLYKLSQTLVNCLYKWWTYSKRSFLWNTVIVLIHGTLFTSSIFAFTL